ncbi:MAG: zf-HC2 domain-containing protein [Treponema sp.]|nr:zf-HC2 domain-containing protein [Treponema sp.]MCL2252256.1 zf-HC2 domain-containing protein [Treponema sp.]
MMCPEPQLLSIYLDGELPSPWKEKLQEHISQCSVCKAKLDNFAYLQKLLNNDKAQTEQEDRTFTEQELLETQERVWDKIEAHKHYTPKYGMWQRRVSIPLPAAAAAAIIIALLAAFLIRDPGRTGFANQRGSLETQIAGTFNPANFLLASDEEIQSFPSTDMNGMIQYLSPEGNTNIIILQLPESQSFLKAGEPAIIRAADWEKQHQPSRDRNHRRNNNSERRQKQETE